MDQILHNAAQYLAAAANSFRTHEADDSHANLGWDGERGIIISRDINELGLKLAINTLSYSIEFVDGAGRTVSGLSLENTSHQEILLWITDFARLKGVQQPLKWDFNYELPFHKDAASYVFPKADLEAIEQLRQMRTDASLAFYEATEGIDGVSEQRIWPHHFDLGVLIEKGETPTKALYVGLAIPDELVDDHYLYVNPWVEGKELDLGGLNKPATGKWLNGDWKGSVMEAPQRSIAEMVDFLNVSFEELERFFQ